MKVPGLVGCTRCLDQSVTLASREVYNGKLLLRYVFGMMRAITLLSIYAFNIIHIRVVGIGDCFVILGEAKQGILT